MSTYPQPPVPPVTRSMGPIRPVSGPQFPYDPRTFGQLYLAWAIVFGVGFALSIIYIGLLVVVAAVVIKCVFLYKAWNQIQDGHQRTTPGKAVGFLFIPFFNFYWIFVAYYGLSQDLGAYCDRYGIAAERPSNGLALALCILWLCQLIPIIGWIGASIAVAIISYIMLWQFKCASEAIALARLQAAAERS